MAVIQPKTRHLIHYLAPEILGNIFSQIPQIEFGERDSVSTVEAPLLLLRVCQRWRSIAFGTPVLWTELAITCGSSRVPHIPDPVLVFRTWLGSAGALPIKVALLPSKRKERSDEIMQLLVENLHRLQELRVADSLHAPFVTHLLLHPLPIMAPTLQRIYIPNGHLNPSMSSTRLTGCIHVPNLESLWLKSQFVLSLLSLAPTSLRSLTLDLGDFEGRPPILRMLPLCSSLEFLDIRFHSEIVLALPSCIRLPNLRCLTLNVTASPDVDPIFQKFDVPRLEEFAVCAPTAMWPKAEILSFHCAVPPLRRLVLTTTLKRSIWDAHDTIKSLLRLPHLEHLQLHGGIVPESTLKALIRGEGPTGSWLLKESSLSILVFKRCSFPEEIRDLMWITNPIADSENNLNKAPGCQARARLCGIVFENCTFAEHTKEVFKSLWRTCGVRASFRES